MKTVIIQNNITEYLRLRNDGWKTIWTGNGMICMGKTINEETK